MLIHICSNPLLHVTILLKRHPPFVGSVEELISLPLKLTSFGPKRDLHGVVISSTTIFKKPRSKETILLQVIVAFQTIEF